jgi:hypothetical protein
LLIEKPELSALILKNLGKYFKDKPKSLNKFITKITSVELKKLKAEKDKLIEKSKKDPS